MFSRVGPFTNMPGDVLPEYTADHRVTKDKIQFGFHPVGGRNAHFSRDLLVAGCCNHGGHAVCYGAWPFRGRSEMEVKIIGIPYNDSISAYEQELLMGLMKRKKGTGHVDSHSDVPRCSQDKPSDHFIVYQSYKVSNKMDPKNIVVNEYGYRTTLRCLSMNDTIGMQVTEAGELYFYVKGVCQGLAASNVYMEDYDTYPFFELRGNVHVVRITKALVAKEDITLQQLCMQVISNSLTLGDNAMQLPLPGKFQEAIKENCSDVYTGCVPERYKKVWNYLFEEKKYKKNTSSRFMDFFKFCLIDSRKKQDPYFFERMQRRMREDGGGDGRKRRRDHDYFYDEFMLEGSPWKNMDFWS